MTRPTPQDRLAADLSALDHAITRARSRSNADFDLLSAAVRAALLKLGREVQAETPRRALAARLRAECLARGHAITGDDHIAAKAAADMLAVSDRTLREWREAGAPIPFRHYHTGAVQYPLQGLADYLAGLEN